MPRKPYSNKDLSDYSWKTEIFKQSNLLPSLIYKIHVQTNVISNSKVSVKSNFLVCGSVVYLCKVNQENSILTHNENNCMQLYRAGHQTNKFVTPHVCTPMCQAVTESIDNEKKYHHYFYAKISLLQENLWEITSSPWTSKNVSGTVL